MSGPRPGEKGTIQPLFFRPEQSQLVFGMSRKVLYRLAAEGSIGIYKLGTMTFFKVSEVTQVLEAHRQ